jgi:hypothetical protein
MTKMKSRRQRQRKNRSARHANKSNSGNSRRRWRILRGGKIYNLEGLGSNDQRTTFLIDTGLIQMDDGGVYRPTDALITFLNTDIANIRNYNRMELMTNNIAYTLFKEPLPTVNPPMKLQIMQNSSSANYGDAIPVYVY